MIYSLYTDGGARGNPGPAAIGGVLKDAHGKLIERYGIAIGSTTNNQAEYQSLIHGLRLAVQREVRDLQCFLDSELIVKQLQGVYRVKDKGLQEHVASIRDLIGSFDTISFSHIPRSRNAEADALVNEALDKA